ncbi:MAG: TolC family protein [Deltaproteobacteria bacterium]
MQSRFNVISPSKAILPVLIAGLLFFLPAIPQAGAQTKIPERRMSVIDAVRTALADNHEIKAGQSMAYARDKEIGIARSYLLPKLYVEGRYLRTTNPSYAFMSRLNQERINAQDFDPERLNHPDPINDFQSSLTLEQPLFVQKAYVGLSMSRTEARAAKVEVLRKKEEIAFQVVKACLAIASLKEYARSVEQAVEETREHKRVADLRYQNEIGQYADALRTATALMEARQKKSIAEKNLSLAKRGLGLLLATTEAIDVEDGGIDFPLNDLPVYLAAADSRSDIHAAELRSENAAQNIRIAEAGYFPYVGVGGTYQMNDHNFPLGSEGTNWQVMAFLRWDLFDGTKREFERAKAKHLASGAREQTAALKKGVSYKIYEAYLNVEEARKNIELAEETLKTADEGTRLLKMRYENGFSSLADLLSAQSSLEQARAGLVERRNAYQTALATLSFESGTILKDLNLDRETP